MQLHERTDQGKPQSSSFITAPQPAINLAEGLKRHHNLVITHPNSRVTHLETGAILVHTNHHLHLPAFRGKFNCSGEEVDKYLKDTAAIPPYG